MKQKNKSMYFIVIVCVLCALYNLNVFLLRENYTETFWISYGFTMVAFVIQLLLIFLAERSKKQGQNVFYSLPMFIYSTIYLGVQLFVGVLCMLLPFSIKVVLITQMLLFVVFVALIMLVTFGKVSIKEREDSTRVSTEYIRLLTIRMENLYQIERDEARKAELKKVYEAVKYSDPVSSTEDIKEIEIKIDVLYEQIKKDLESTDFEVLKSTCNKMINLLSERNLVCRVGK